jgi:hypothetical protein
LTRRARGVRAGNGASDHCHATASDRTWQDARRARQAALNPAPAPAPPPVQQHSLFYYASLQQPHQQRGPAAAAPLLPGHVRTPPSAPELLQVRRAAWQPALKCP